MHVEAGAKRVLISAPAKDPDVTLVLGVNEGDFDGFAASRGFRFARVAVEGTTPTLYLSNDEAPAPKTKTKTGPGRGKRTGPSRGKHSKRQKQGHKARR
jgi:hypothetical protein